MIGKLNLKICPVCACGNSVDDTVLASTQIRRCPACTHRYAAEIQPVAYDELYQAGLYRQTLILPTQCAAATGGTLEQTHEPFFKRITPFGAGRLLEIACGTGRFSYEASQRGWNVVACDSSPAAIAAAREAFGKTVDFHVADAFRAPEGPFEVISAIEFLEHNAEPLEILRSMAGRATTGGIVYVTVPNWRSRGVRESTNAAWVPPIHVQFFTRRSLQQLLKCVPAINHKTVQVGFIPAITSLFPITQFSVNQPDGLWALARVR